MKAKHIFFLFLIFFSFAIQLNAQKTSLKETTKQKTVLLINTHLTYPGWSEGKLNASFYNKAKEFFLSKNYKVLETKVENGYNADQEVEKHLQTDIVILQTPVNWENTPWIYKKYVAEVFNSGMFSKNFSQATDELENMRPDNTGPMDFCERNNLWSAALGTHLQKVLEILISNYSEEQLQPIF